MIPNSKHLYHANNPSGLLRKEILPKSESVIKIKEVEGGSKNKRSLI